MNRFKLTTVLLLGMTIFFCECSMHGKQSLPVIPFNNIEYTLIYGKVNDSTICFNREEGRSFTVTFKQGKFRTFDGSFFITGISQDTASMFYTRTPYAGFLI